MYLCFHNNNATSTWAREIIHQTKLEFEVEHIVEISLIINDLLGAISGVAQADNVEGIYSFSLSTRRSLIKGLGWLISRSKPEAIKKGLLSTLALFDSFISLLDSQHEKENLLQPILNCMSMLVRFRC